MAATAAQERLIKQMFESEIQYREIEWRANQLLAISPRSPEQEAALAQYQASMQHDRDLIFLWYQNLRAEGVSRGDIVSNPTLRNSLLDWAEARLQAERAAIVALFEAEWASWQENHPEATPEELAAYHAWLDADEAGRLAVVDRLLAHVASLRTGGLTWQL